MASIVSAGEFALKIKKISKQAFVALLCFLLVGFTAQPEAYGSMGQSNDQPPASTGKQSPQELQQLVAPIALDPDALVAQILAASTYPTQIVEADRWVQSHPNLKGEELAKEVDESGAIYERDLGPNTTKTAEAMTTYDPDSSWHKTE